MTRRLTLEEFISKARKKHGDKYDYKHVVYNGNKTPVYKRNNDNKIIIK